MYKLSLIALFISIMFNHAFAVNGAGLDDGEDDEAVARSVNLKLVH